MKVKGHREPALCVNKCVGSSLDPNISNNAKCCSKVKSVFLKST